MKLKFNLKRNSIEAIKKRAIRLGLYDDNFSEEEQCGGYYAFRDLCLSGYPIPTAFDIDSEGKLLGSFSYHTTILEDLSRLHPNIRASSLILAKFVRSEIRNPKE
jgi:hypothetical protein